MSEMHVGQVVTGLSEIWRLQFAEVEQFRRIRVIVGCQMKDVSATNCCLGFQQVVFVKIGLHVCVTEIFEALVKFS